MRRPCVVAVTENGETRYGLTTAFTGLGGIPYRLLRRNADEAGKPLPLFENMRIKSEISLEQYQEYLDHPEHADDFSAMIEINMDRSIIRIDEDMGQEREYHEYPIDLLLETAQQLRSSFTLQGSNMIPQKRIYKAMECDNFAKALEGQWQAEANPSQQDSPPQQDTAQINMELGGLTL